MNPERDPDSILAAWLDEGPTDLPDVTRRAIVAALPTTNQRRRPIWAPRRFNPMSAPLRAALAVLAAAVVIGGGIYLLGPRSSGPGGVPTPSPSPSVSADLLDVSRWTAFMSSRYGFSAKYPATFEANPSQTFWRIPNALAIMFDGFHGEGAVKWLNGVSMLLPAGESRDEWYAAYRQDLVGDAQPWEPESCFAPREDWTAATVDGRAADLRVGCEELEAFVFVDDRVYMFGAYGYEGVTPPTTEPGVPDDLRELFELWLTTITLDPASAVDPTPAPTPNPS